jgi:hypothetical protein
MYDYLKIWIEDREQIKKILSLSFLSFTGSYNVRTGEILQYPLLSKWSVFELRLISATRMQITGSLHKFWNRGTNENDFHFRSVITAINDLCRQLKLNPSLATIHNLEFGVNITPSIAASEIIEEILCFKNERPLRPYEGNNDQFYFIEFHKGNYYFKIYDKGRQYKTKNILRIEIKAMRSAELKQAGAITLKDLRKKTIFKVLGKKLMQFSNNLVYNDSTINLDHLIRKDKRKYIEYSNPNKWRINGLKTTTQYRNEQRFITIVEKYGTRKLHPIIRSLIESKIHLLDQNCNTFLSKYNTKPLQRKVCVSCGRDISNQNNRSKFCSPKYVGEAAAHECRNSDSNPRNNLKRKINRIMSKGVLFDIGPFIVTRKRKKKTA